jgi:hypothetical protein
VQAFIGLGPFFFNEINNHFKQSQKCPILKYFLDLDSIQKQLQIGQKNSFNTYELRKLIDLIGN